VFVSRNGDYWYANAAAATQLGIALKLARSMAKTIGPWKQKAGHPRGRA
jgi:hypothetical protein